MPAAGNPSGLKTTVTLSQQTALKAVLHSAGRTHTTASEFQKDQRGRVTPTPGEDRQQVHWRVSEERRQTRKNKQKG